MNLFIIGRRTQGKSTLAIYLARFIQRKVNAHTIFIFDPKRTYKSVPYTSDLGEFESLIEKSGHDAVAYQPFRQPTSDTENDRDAVNSEFVAFVDALAIERHLGVEHGARRPTIGPIIIIVDEAWYLQKSNFGNNALEKLVRLADTDKVYLIQVSHRPGEFYTGCRAQSDELYFFRQWLASDIEVVREWCGDEVAGIVETLPDHHVLRVEVNSGRTELFDRPEVWFSNIKGGMQPSPREGTEHDGLATVSASDGQSNAGATAIGS